MCDCTEKSDPSLTARENLGKPENPFRDKKISNNEIEFLMIHMQTLHGMVDKLEAKVSELNRNRQEDLQRLHGRMDSILKSCEKDSDNLFSRLSKIEREFYNHTHADGSIAIKVT